MEIGWQGSVNGNTHTHTLCTHVTSCVYGLLAPNILIKFLTSQYSQEPKTYNGWCLLEFCMKRPSQRYFSLPLLLGFVWVFVGVFVCFLFPIKSLTCTLCCNLANSNNDQSFSLPFCPIRIKSIRGSSMNYVCRALRNHKREGAVQGATIITVISKAVGGKEDKIRISVCNIYTLHCSQDFMNS